jgi:uncharacterized protein (TIGR00369 family)
MTFLPPYAEFLGLQSRREEDGALLMVMPWGDRVLGRPGYLHGGAIAGLLEFAAFATLIDQIGDPDTAVKPINVTVNFMRGGTAQETFAAARVTRLGKRVANVEAHAWQDDRTKPIAAAQLNVLLRRP